ncbi:MAG: hypothetical protein AAGA58_10965 [Verrucomicrobiota bacterium]
MSSLEKNAKKQALKRTYRLAITTLAAYIGIYLSLRIAGKPFESTAHLDFFQIHSREKAYFEIPDSDFRAEWMAEDDIISDSAREFFDLIFAPAILTDEFLTETQISFSSHHTNWGKASSGFNFQLGIRY